MTKVEPLQKKAQAGETTYLPYVAVIHTTEGKTLVHRILWGNGAKRCYGQTGGFEERGELDGLSVRFPVR